MNVNDNAFKSTTTARIRSATRMVAAASSDSCRVAVATKSVGSDKDVFIVGAKLARWPVEWIDASPGKASQFFPILVVNFPQGLSIGRLAANLDGYLRTLD